MSKGRFGIHGGQYISGDTDECRLELEECYEHYKKDPEFNGELNELFNEYAGRPSQLYYAEQDDRGSGRREGLFEERGFEPYRRPQDQQCAGTGASCKEDGKNPCDRRDRCRTAWCGYRYGSRLDGDGM